MSFNVKARAFRPFRRIEVFDGRSLKGYWPRDANTSPLYAPPRFQEEVYFWHESDLGLITNSIDLPLFYAHGFFGVRPGDFRSARLSSLPDLEAVGEAEISGRPCIVLREQTNQPGEQLRRATYYVDVERDGAIVRTEVHGVNDSLQDVTAIDYTRTDRGWMPASWSCTFYEGSVNPAKNRVLRVYTLSVVEITWDPVVSAGDFQIPLRPGMIVRRRDRNHERLIVASDGETLEPLQGSGKGGANQTSTGHASWPLLVIGLNGVGLAVLAACLLYLRRRRT